MMRIYRTFYNAYFIKYSPNHLFDHLVESSHRDNLPSGET